MNEPRLQRRRAYTNVLLFVGVLALAIVAWLDHQNKLPERRVSGAATPPDASLVAFVNANNINTELRRQNGLWQLTLPVQHSARESRVNRLLELLDERFSEGFDLADVNAVAAQLDDTARLLQLDNNLYRFGGLEPVSGKRYVQLEDKVLLLEDRYLPLMNGGINAFADLQMTTPPSATIELAGVALGEEEQLAWRNTQAMGVRTASAAPNQNKSIHFEKQAAPWLAWPEKGLWILQPPKAGIEYLINSAQAATLGIN
ncbi:MAG: hypothetical protein ACPGSC_01020 [Granulosicoccaceae bacterium]